MSPTSDPEREGEERWKVWVCRGSDIQDGCGKVWDHTEPPEHMSCDDWEVHGDFVPAVVRADGVSLARLAEVEQEREAAEEWIQEVGHVEDCAAFDRGSSRECDCGRTAILKREGSG